MPKDPATENMESIMMKPLRAFPTQDHDAHITAHRAFMSTGDGANQPTSLHCFTSTHI